MNNLTLPQQIERLDADRFRAYSENLAFYGGAQWAGRTRRKERRLTFNYARSFIDKITSYLMADIGFSIDPNDASDESARKAEEATHALAAAYRDNDLQQLDFDTELDAAVLGDGVYKVTWDAEEERVRVSAPDVQGIFVWWVGDDVNRVWRVASRYKLSPDEVGLHLWRRGPCLGGRGQPFRLHHHRGLDCRLLRDMDRQCAAPASAQPLRLHPIRRLPQHP